MSLDQSALEKKLSLEFYTGLLWNGYFYVENRVEIDRLIDKSMNYQIYALALTFRNSLIPSVGLCPQPLWGASSKLCFNYLASFR
jgi:hypothetical protein